MASSVVAFIVSGAVFYLHNFLRARNEEKDLKDAVTYQGSCHCTTVRFTVQAPRLLTVWVCNCSICDMKKNDHFIVNSKNFQLDGGQDNITEYTFNTKVAKHKFCSVGGICSFYHPRSNPDGIAVTLSCLDNYHELIRQNRVRYNTFDGINWERYIEKSGIDVYSR